MPAQDSQLLDEKEVCFHVYNKGVDNKVIFNDEEDYHVFLGYLNDYLTAPADPENNKKVFTIKGRTFRGVPHQPKNYFNKVELIAYSLMPNHFHLLLHKKTKGSIEKLLRSLCTRYSMYFNKKYQRRGRLFMGPYKSVQIKGLSRLLYLTRYFHHRPKENGEDLTDCRSSYAEYLGARETSWVKPKVVLAWFEKSENNFFKGKPGYRNFVEKYELNQNEMKLLEEIIIESKHEHSGRKGPSNAEDASSEETQIGTVKRPLIKIPAFMSISIVGFVLLIELGIKNIWTSTTIMNNITLYLPSPTPLVLREESTPLLLTPQTPLVSGVKDEKQDPENVLTIKIIDELENVNIRQEPTAKSKRIAKAKGGDTFEYVSTDSGWYQIKLADGLIGYVSEGCAEIESEENN